jgi:hypothetical protein
MLLRTTCPGCRDVNQFGKTAAAAACLSVLRHAGLSGGTYFAPQQITASGSLSLQAPTMRESLS